MTSTTTRTRRRRGRIARSRRGTTFPHQTRQNENIYAVKKSQRQFAATTATATAEEEQAWLVNDVHVAGLPNTVDLDE